MLHKQIHMESSGIARQFRTAVSLHGHTAHSRERLDFIYRYAKSVGPIRAALQRGEERYRSCHRAELDLSCAWWTPPVVPHDAWLLEKNEIERRFGLHSIVSLTDHDDIEAPVALRVLDECRDLPVSVEWTVPYGGTFFHLGVHNLPPDSAREEMGHLASFTAQPESADLRPILERLTAYRDSLIVFNHPCWDESGIGHETHHRTACDFLVKYGSFLHALELNGMRPWGENRSVIKLAGEFGKPLISGGDRHALEPNTILNLTNASDFSEFAAEVRAGSSTVLITHAYREPFALRMLQNLDAIMGDHSDHGLGWKHWTDRVFFKGPDGVTRPLTGLFSKPPRAVDLFVRGVRALRHPQMRWAFRVAFCRGDEVTL